MIDNDQPMAVTSLSALAKALRENSVFETVDAPITLAVSIDVYAAIVGALETAAGIQAPILDRQTFLNGMH